jgi:hypothetical protein
MREDDWVKRAIEDGWSREDIERQQKANRRDAWARVFWPAVVGAFLGTMLAFQVLSWIS